jgi:hypothetical protein
LDADARFWPRGVNRYDVEVTTTVERELADSASRSCMYVIEEDRRRGVLEELRRLLETHPETAGRDALSYTRPCTLHLCRRR